MRLHAGYSEPALNNVVGASSYPNIWRWPTNMKKFEHWDEINEAMYRLANQAKEQPFESIGA